MIAYGNRTDIDNGGARRFALEVVKRVTYGADFSLFSVERGVTAAP